MYKLGSILKNEIHKILWDFEIKTDHQIPAKRPNLAIITKKENLDFAISTDHRLKIKGN